MTIKEAQKKIAAIALEHGWNISPNSIPEMVALIHSEASEALECFRNDERIDYIDNGKPSGISSEFADIVIRVLHYSEVLNIDLESAILRKMTYNEGRPFRHGNKKC